MAMVTVHGTVTYNVAVTVRVDDKLIDEECSLELKSLLVSEADIKLKNSQYDVEWDFEVEEK